MKPALFVAGPGGISGGRRWLVCPLHSVIITSIDELCVHEIMNLSRINAAIHYLKYRVVNWLQCFLKRTHTGTIILKSKFSTA